MLRCGSKGVFSGSSAARGFAVRTDLERMRFVQTRHPWEQEWVREGPVRGKNNPADLFTKKKLLPS